jgi:hypothetical protein
MEQVPPAAPTSTGGFMDASDVVGPDRALPCGCHVINGAICFVSKVENLDLKNLYLRPGKFIAVDGPKEVQ